MDPPQESWVLSIGTLDCELDWERGRAAECAKGIEFVLVWEFDWDNEGVFGSEVFTDIVMLLVFEFCFSDI